MKLVFIKAWGENQSHLCVENWTYKLTVYGWLVRDHVMLTTLSLEYVIHKRLGFQAFRWRTLSVWSLQCHKSVFTHGSSGEVQWQGYIVHMQYPHILLLFGNSLSTSACRYYSRCFKILLPSPWILYVIDYCSAVCATWSWEKFSIHKSFTFILRFVKFLPYKLPNWSSR